MSDAILFAAFILSTLIALVIIRFAFNLCIDICILDNVDSAKRELQQLWMRVTLRRVTDNTTTTENSQQQRQEQASPRVIEKVNATELLPYHTVSQQHIDKWRTESEEEENCSICLQEFKTGEVFTTAPCEHIFHKKCIGEWLNNSKDAFAAECPNCRQFLFLGVAQGQAAV